MSKLKTQTHSSIQTTISMCLDSVPKHIDMLKKSNEGDLFLSKLKTKLGQIDLNNASFDASGAYGLIPHVKIEK